MKTILKVTLMVAILGSTAMADGEMGSGGFQPCTVNCPPPPPIAQQQGDDMTPITSETVTTTEVVIDFVKDTLELLF